MLKIFLLLLSLIIPTLSEETLEEYTITCYGNKKRYKINNSQNKKYLLFIAHSNIKEYYLYENDIEIPYQTHSDRNYYYPIEGKKELYLEVSISVFCWSFRFIDYDSIILKNNEEFLYPIVADQTIETKIKNVKNKFFVLSIKNLSEYKAITISINRNSYEILNGKIISLIHEEEEMDLKMNIPYQEKVAAIKYISTPYTNISSDTLKCIDNFESMHTYIIKGDKNKYLFISYSNNLTEYYENNLLKKGLNYFSLNSRNNFLIMKGKGCFNVLYLDEFHLEIKDGISYKILNSKEYEFKINNKGLEMSLSIYSSEDNFINKLYVRDNKKNLKIEKSKNLFVYNVKIDSYYESTYIYIYFNLNNKQYINVEFKTEDNSSNDFVALYVIFGVAFFIIFGCIFFRCYIKRKIEKKEEDVKEKKLLEKNERDKKTGDIYSLIKKDFAKITRICLFCTGDKYLDIEQNYYDIGINKIDIIEDINNGNFSDLYSYITPDKCCHSFHYDCCTKYNFNKEDIKNPDNCPFCKIFLTLDNMNKFGCFFSEGAFNSLYPITKKTFDVNKRTMIMEIEKVFYSKIKSSSDIDPEKKDRLLRLKKINQKFYDNMYFTKFDYFTYYKKNYNNNLDKMEEDLDNEIRKEIEYRREKNKQRREYENEYRPIPLKRCYDCKDICFVCFGSVKLSKGYITYGHYEHTLYAHNKCLENKDRNLCWYCRKKEGTADCTSTCIDCLHNFKVSKVSERCYYCKQKLNFAYK